MTELISAQREIFEDIQRKEKLNNEEFKIWKKTVPLLYDTIQTHALPAPSFSVQWLPAYEFSDNKNFIAVKALVGSENALKLVLFNLPSTLASDFQTVLPNSQGVPVPQFTESDVTGGFKVIQTWKHNGDVNKIKLSPDGTKVLTFDKEGVVHLYELSKEGDEVASFKYHKEEGFALEWIDNSKFLSGSKDSQIALWEISKSLTPVKVFKSHTATVNDISYNQKNLFISVSDDLTTQVFDLEGSTQSVIKIENNYVQNSIRFHPEVPTLYLSGGNDNVITLYDLRNPTKEIRKFFGHIDSVIGIKWDLLTDPSVFLSWGLDKRVIQWDINSIDEDFTYPTTEEPVSTGPGPKRKAVSGKSVDPCMKFIHGGHTGRVNEVDLHPRVKGLVVSSGNDNLLEVWRSKTIFEDVEEEDEEEK